LFDPLLSTDNDSPLPSPSELPNYITNKVIEARAKMISKTLLPITTTHVATPTKKLLHSPKIPPSGTSVKREFETFKHKPRVPPLKREMLDTSSDTSHDSDDSNSKDSKESSKDEEYIQIAHLKVQSLEFTYVFPAFPTTHAKGYAYIIELSDEILNEKALLNLRDALQYSLTNGGGPRLLENVKFFASEGQKVQMKIHFRQCAGTISHL
jgi:hypothetical protein